MQLETTRFGVVEVDENSTIDVPSGVPGFSDMRRVTLLGAGAMPGVPAVDDQNSMFWMQDLDDGARAFLCIDPWMTFPDYDVEIDEKALEIKDDEQCVRPRPRDGQSDRGADDDVGQPSGPDRDRPRHPSGASAHPE